MHLSLSNLNWTLHEVESSFFAWNLRHVRNESGLKLLIRDKKEPLLLLREKWHILREACEPSLWPWASYQKFVNAKLDTGQPSPSAILPSWPSAPGHSPTWNFCSPGIPTPTTYLSSPRVTFVYLIFRAIQQSLGPTTATGSLWTRREIRCVREIPELLPHTFLNGICQQLDRSTQETDLPTRPISRTCDGKTISLQIGTLSSLV